MLRLIVAILILLSSYSPALAQGFPTSSSGGGGATVDGLPTFGLTDVEITSNYQDAPQATKLSDGFVAQVFVNGDSDIIYFHCLSADCATHNQQTINTDQYGDAVNPIQTGSDGFARFLFEGNDGIHYVQCQNLSCSMRTDNAIDAMSAGQTYTMDFALRSGNVPIIVYEDYNRTPSGVVEYVCSNAACSSGTRYELTQTPTTYNNYLSGVILDASGFPIILVQSTIAPIYQYSPVAIFCGALDCTTPSVIRTFTNFPGYPFWFRVRGSLDGANKPRFISSGIIVVCSTVTCESATPAYYYPVAVDLYNSVWASTWKADGFPAFAHVDNVSASSNVGMVNNCPKIDCSFSDAAITGITNSDVDVDQVSVVELSTGVFAGFFVKDGTQHYYTTASATAPEVSDAVSINGTQVQSGPSSDPTKTLTGYGLWKTGCVLWTNCSITPSAIYLGYGITPGGEDQISIGNFCQHGYSHSIGIGFMCYSGGYDSIAIGTRAVARGGISGIAFGADTIATGNNSIAFGNGAKSIHGIQIFGTSNSDAGMLDTNGRTPNFGYGSSLGRGQSGTHWFMPNSPCSAACTGPAIVIGPNSFASTVNGVGGGIFLQGGTPTGTAHAGLAGLATLKYGTGSSGGTFPTRVETGGSFGYGLDDLFHIVTNGVATSVSSCGSGATRSGNDISGSISVGSAATGCVLTFGSPWLNTNVSGDYSAAIPNCTVTSRGGIVFSYALSSTAITVTAIGALSSTVLDYKCSIDGANY